jgi:hypothetical protein
MAKGLSLHIGLTEVDPKIHGSTMRAPGCDKVAFAMRDIARKQGFSGPEPLINGAATRLNFLEGAVALMQQLQDGDILFISVAGHGILHVAVGDKDENRDQALLLFDGKLADDTLHDALAAIPVKARVIVVAEACFSGSVLEAVGESAELAAWRDRAVNFPIRPRGALIANVLLLAAASDSGVALGPVPSSPSSMPPFTEALVELWEHATSYEDLHGRMSERAAGPRPFTIPVLNQNLVNEPAFVQQRPFTI